MRNDHLTDYSKPSPRFERFVNTLTTAGSALDIGSDSGRNAIFLAENGWDVTAIDTDDQALEALDSSALQRALKIQTVETDLLEYEPNRQFELIVCNMVLHFLPANKVDSGIEKLRSWIAPGGYIFASAFTEENPTNVRPYLFKTNELKNYFSDWEIIEYSEAFTSWIIPEGQTKRERYMAGLLIARKLAEG